MTIYDNFLLWEYSLRLRLSLWLFVSSPLPYGLETPGKEIDRGRYRMWAKIKTKTFKYSSGEELLEKIAIGDMATNIRSG